jgi:hypothetical protein
VAHCCRTSCWVPEKKKRKIQKIRWWGLTGRSTDHDFVNPTSIWITIRSRKVNPLRTSITDLQC